MSKLSQLQGKSKTFTIGPIELEIKPLKIDDMNLFITNKEACAKEQTENSLKLIDKVLSDSVSDSTPEERKNIGLEYMEPLMNAIMEVNGMSKDDVTGNISDALEARKAQIQAKREKQ